MHSFRHDGVDIAYLDEGEGEPIVLVHGFASTKEVNWVYPGWVSTLTRAGRRVIALDNRGHGASTKLYDPAAYHSAVMAEDVRALLDHLGIARADVMGYSMGARIAAFLALAHPERVRSVVLGGLGIRLVDGVGLAGIDRRCARSAVACRRAPIRRAGSSAPSPSRPSPTCKALAACIRGSRQTLSRQDAPGSPCRCWSRSAPRTMWRARRRSSPRCCPQGEALDIPGRDHMLAVGDRVFKAGRAGIPGSEALTELSGNPLEHRFFAAIYELSGASMVEFAIKLVCWRRLWRRDTHEPQTRSTRSIRSGRASATRPRRSCGASPSSRPSSIRPSCITTRWKPRSCIACRSGSIIPTSRRS